VDQYHLKQVDLVEEDKEVKLEHQEWLEQLIQVVEEVVEVEVLLMEPLVDQVLL
jgi:hypothetical protein